MGSPHRSALERSSVGSRSDASVRIGGPWRNALLPAERLSPGVDRRQTGEQRQLQSAFLRPPPHLAPGTRLLHRAGPHPSSVARRPDALGHLTTFCVSPELRTVPLFLRSGLLVADTRGSVLCPAPAPGTQAPRSVPAARPPRGTVGDVRDGRSGLARDLPDRSWNEPLAPSAFSAQLP